MLSNGTIALTLPLLTLDLPPGAKVLVPTFTFAASAIDDRASTLRSLCG